jgi:hypothetical protein
MSLRWPNSIVTKNFAQPSPTSAPGLWKLNTAAAAEASGSWPSTISDPYFENVSLLLTGNGTNGAQNNTFLDSSVNNATITRNGNTTQGTFSPYGNLWSNYFGAVGQYLTPSGTPSAIVGTLNGSTNICIECWIFPTAYNTTQYPAVIGDMNPTSEADYWSFGINASGQVTMYWYTGSGVLCYSTNAVSLNTWSHIAVNINAGAITLYINGVSQTLNGTTTLGTVAGSLGYLIIGQWNNGGAGNSGRFSGYISNLRVTKSSVYTSNFTPSITPLTAVSGTSLLTCQSNRFIDNSSNNFTLTVNGNTSVQRFSPFNPTAAYSAATIGGSGYFDGTGDYLKIGSTNAPVSWLNTSGATGCIEAWVYPTLFRAGSQIYTSPCVVGLGGTYFNFGLANGTPRFYWWTGALNYLDSSIPAKLNSWNHIAVTFNGSGSNNLKIYVNGVLGATGTFTNIAWASGSGGNNCYIGTEEADSATSAFPGYINDVRIVNGSAVYTSNFTPPTAPLTAISGTTLLTNFTNAGIPDAAMMNDLETVGNAQVSTSVKKYGTGSLQFIESGAYLSMRTVPQFAFGTGDFTIEAWVYRSGSLGVALIDTRSGGNYSDYVAYVSSSGQVGFVGANAGARLDTAETIPSNTWNHVAIVRSSGTIRAYLNGVVSVTTVSYPGAINTASTTAWVGASKDPGYSTAYVDELRITNGYARYTANFTPPSKPFPLF